MDIMEHPFRSNVQSLAMREISSFGQDNNCRTPNVQWKLKNSIAFGIPVKSEFLSNKVHIVNKCCFKYKVCPFG